MKLLSITIMGFGLITSAARGDVLNTSSMLDNCIAQKSAKIQKSNHLVELRNQYIANQDLKSVLILDDALFQGLTDDQQNDLDCLNAVKNELKSFTLEQPLHSK